jgi:hypothetical protein
MVNTDESWVPGLHCWTAGLVQETDCATSVLLFLAACRLGNATFADSMDLRRVMGMK